MLTEGQVILHEPLGDEEQKLRKLVLKSPIASKAEAGQFTAVQVKDSAVPSFDPLLRRPISLAGISSEKEEITLLYRIQGRGTEILARAQVGDRLSMMGPLGCGFSLPAEGELWLIAGGIGIFPLYPLAQKAMAQGLQVRLFWGAENRPFLESAGLTSWQALGIPIELSTLDGSLGHKGLVTEPVGNLLEKQEIRGNIISAATCGPKKMMQAVTELCLARQVPVQVSLEERMGCAVGACLGCAVALIDETGAKVHKKVCQDGPVFQGKEVVWDESC
ncbi:2-polyprenylphenol hydroxylase-like oxidoreductase [Desulfosporosinus orientis DSM 765]|uniref:2-polyprenylphenol hydroxylase-like oxidoreductase n=1 Tax=Desulfosporosinus orientis (strain ATCC 19365 / DSM 765 / NCIMB 8382 / VKM B-1628 / Singapore I) TaxID=768706 RepID=G7WH91_DESOD|nr:dihydroorotate dehydrogenase electron transfer subunit [Desulfosporosinus orientis]AET70181.1 2-polyprenylphenol hydroxylase-like oxidoreductase [Desulfosporosinus orientis DSM 765]